jgi:hypothetical protein
LAKSERLSVELGQGQESGMKASSPRSGRTDGVRLESRLLPRMI